MCRIRYPGSRITRVDWSLRPAVVPWLLIGIFLFALAATVYRRQSASRVARLFTLMMSLMGGWCLAFAVMLGTTNGEIAVICGKVAFAAATLLAGVLYDFTSTALRLSERSRWLVRISRFLSVTAALIILLSDVVVAGTPHVFSWGMYPRFTSAGGWIFTLMFAVVLLLHLLDCVHELWRTADTLRRRRIAQLMLSYLIVYVAMLDFRAAFGVDARPVGWVPVSLFVAFAWRSIRRHRFTPITAARAATDILETMADALFVLDQDGRIRVANRAARSLFGYGDADLMGRTLDVLEPDPPAGSASLAADLPQLVVENTVRDHERVFRDRNGNPVDVSISISGVHDRDGAGGSVVIIRDIRERKRGENELREFTERLQQSNRELEEFAHVASHDLQEPLRKIQAFGDRLRTKFGDGLPPEGLDYLARMQNAAGRMQVLINDLLAFSRITTRGRPFTRVDLSQIVAEVLHDLEVTVHEADARIEMSDLPELDADALQMRQLFQNLIGNALKFRDPARELRVWLEGRVEGDWVRIEIRDNGIGFDQKYAERIFTIFERLHGRTAYAGTGIGLAICRKILERHHGTIEARSVTGEGTTFTMQLPAHQVTGAPLQ